MNTWSIKEVCKLAQVSARALHYYDKIGLLKPSARSANGYRLYSQEDLDRLEKITALKFLGFMLNSIQVLVEIDDQSSLLKNLSNQQLCLNHEAKHIQEGQIKLLKEVIEVLQEGKEIDWKTLNQKIKDYSKEFEELLKELRNKCLIDQFSGISARFENSCKENELE